MISVFLLAIMILSLYAAFGVGFNSIKTTREDLRATQILSQKLESIRLCTWNQLAQCPTTFKEYYDPTGLTNSTQGATYFGKLSTTGSATNIPSSAAYQTNMHLITVSVTWTNYIGKTPLAHFREMKTMTALYGLQNYIYGYNNFNF